MKGKTWFEAQLDTELAVTLDRLAQAYAHRGKEARAAFLQRLEQAIPSPFRLPGGCGGISIRTDRLPGELPVTGKDGYGEPTPTVRELTAILRALPEEFQDMPVVRYCDEGVAGMRDETSYERDHREDCRTDHWTAHIQMW